MELVQIGLVQTSKYSVLNIARIANAVQWNPDEVLEEATSFLKKLFHGDFEPIPEGWLPPASDHGYAAGLHDFPPPPIPGVPPSTSDHDYGPRTPPKLSSSDCSKSSKTDPTDFWMRTSV